MSPKRLLASAVAVGILIAIPQSAGVAQRRSGGSAILGVWRVSEITYTGPSARTVKNPQPGILIFTRGYYSANVVTADTPRPELPPPDKRTDKDIAQAFGPFSANACTYETKGDEPINRIIVAKNPSVMSPGSFGTHQFRFDGNDSLSMTFVANRNGPIANPTATKLTRAE